MPVFGRRSQSHSVTDPLPERELREYSRRDIAFYDDLRDDSAAGTAEVSRQMPPNSIAVVDAELCATEHTEIKLRENLLTHCCDEFDVSSVAEQKVWMKADGKHCIARNSKMFWAPCGKPMATFSQNGSRMTAAINVNGDGFSFLVRMRPLVCCAVRTFKFWLTIATYTVLCT